MGSRRMRAIDTRQSDCDRGFCFFMMHRERLRPIFIAGTRIVGAMSALMLSGCLSLAPDYEPPSLPVARNFPVASAFPAQAPAAAVATDAAQLAWRAFYRDPQLQTLIEQALANNRDLRIAAQRVEEARALYGIQRADRVPNINLGADATRARLPGDLNITGESQVQSEYRAGLTMLPWELDFWGRVRDLSEAARRSFLATEAAERAARLSLIAQVADSWLRLRELDGRIAVARETTASRSESFRIFRQRVDLGATSRLDLVQVETLLRQSQLLGAQLEQARASQINLLTLLVGAPLDPAIVPPEAPTSIGADLLGSELLGSFALGLPSDLLTERPDIVAAEHLLRGANANIGAARAAFFPRIALTGTFGSASAELDNLFRSGSHAWTFTPTLSLPIFQGGRNVANLDLAEARRNAAVAGYEQTIQVAFREVADALAARRWLDDQVAIQQAELDAQRDRVRMSQLRYDNGAARYLEVLDARRDLLMAGQQLIQLRREYLSSQVRLFNALGGGSAALAAATTPST